MFNFFNYIIESFVTFVLDRLLGFLCSRNPITQCEVFETVLYDHGIISEEEKHISKQKESVFFYEGCVVHSIYKNRTDRDIAIKQMRLIIDSVTSRSFKKVDILCHFDNNKLQLYLINNGNVDVYDLKVKIDVIYDTEGFNERIPLLFQKRLLGDMFNDTYYVEHLSAGEIIRLSIWYPDREYYKKNYHFGGRIVLLGSISDDKGILLQEVFLGALVINDKKLEYYYAQGENGDVEDFSVTVKGQHPQSFSLPLKFAISGKGTKHVQVSVYPSESCAFRYHFELQIADKKHIYKSPIGCAKVFVPLYEPDGGFFFRLREWLIKNDVSRYRYNENRLLQQEIEPVKNRSVQLFKDN